MHLDLLRNYLADQPTTVTRRGALTLGAAVGATALAAAETAAGATGPAPAGAPTDREGSFDDEFFDYSDPANLDDWAPSRYGAGDQRGAFNEVTPEKTAAALRTLHGRGRGVTTFQLGELMTNGFPAYVTNPPRIYEQRLLASGYEPPEDFEEQGGLLLSTETLGVNRINVNEERFACEPAPNFPDTYSTTYQIGTQLDNLNHVGAGDYFYNGFTGPEIARSWGTSKLGNEHMGPIVTRGVLLDVLAVKLRRDPGVTQRAANGQPMLASNYRITIDDLRAAMRHGRIGRIEPGDAVMIRTGWNQLLDRSSGDFVQSELTRWGATGGMPGIYLAEARWLASFRPCIIGSDTWALEVLGSSSNEAGVLYPCHQELLMRHGIRIAESVVLDSLAAAGINEYVHIVTPQFAKGATAGNSPPAGLAVRRR